MLRPHIFLVSIFLLLFLFYCFVILFYLFYLNTLLKIFSVFLKAYIFFIIIFFYFTFIHKAKQLTFLNEFPLQQECVLIPRYCFTAVVKKKNVFPCRYTLNLKKVNF